MTLPVAGREGPPPPWPLSKAIKREAELWVAEWRRPQAVMWERNGQQLEVALYVRALARAEKRDSPIALGTLVRQQQEALGVSLPGLARNRWRIAAEPEGRAAQAPAVGRLKVVPGGAA